MLTMFKVIVKGFLITFVHLQAIEKHLGMHDTAGLLEPHIKQFQEAYEYNDKET